MSSRVFITVMVCVLAATSAIAQAKRFTTSGYFAGIEMTSKESGDYGGISIYLTQTADKTYVFFLEAAGDYMTPKLVEAKMSGRDMRTIEFSIPDDDGERKFKGTVTAANLVLTENGTKHTLKRKCAPTYSDIAISKESGDAGGTEVFLTDAGGTWYAVVSVAEGEIGKPTLVEAAVTGKNFDKVAFTLKGDGWERKLTGTRKASALTLVEEGTRFVLKSKCYQ